MRRARDVLKSLRGVENDGNGLVGKRVEAAADSRVGRLQHAVDAIGHAAFFGAFNEQREPARVPSLEAVVQVGLGAPLVESRFQHGARARSLQAALIERDGARQIAARIDDLAQQGRGGCEAWLDGERPGQHAPGFHIVAKLVRGDTQSQMQQGIGRPGGKGTLERLPRLLVVSGAQRVPARAL